MSDPVVKDWGEYVDVVKELHKDPEADLPGSPRRREVEAAFGQSLQQVLTELEETADSRSDALRRINATLEANGVQQSVSRRTFYNWLDELGLK